MKEKICKDCKYFYRTLTDKNGNQNVEYKECLLTNLPINGIVIECNKNEKI